MSTNLIVNGDFEDLSGGTGPNNTPTGWVKTGPASGVFNANVHRGDGKAYALGGWSGAGGQTLSQDVETSNGEVYELSFSAGGYYGGFSGVLRVVADSAAGPVVLGEFKSADLGNSMSDYALQFTAKAGATNIRFEFAGSGRGDIDLDNIGLHRVETLHLDNGGLEQKALGNGRWTYALDGWDKSGKAGVWNPAVGHFDEEAPGGQNVGFINSGFVSQTLDVPYYNSKTYDLELELGGRKNAGGTNYEVTLMAGDKVVASTTGKTTGRGEWDTVAVSAPSGAATGVNGKPLKVVIKKISGPQLNFDDVKLSIERPIIHENCVFLLQNHHSPKIGIKDYGLWLKGIDGGKLTVFDFEAPGAEMFLIVNGDTITIQGTAIARTKQSDGKFVNEGTFEIDFTYADVTRHPTDNDLVVLPEFDGTPVGTISRLDDNGTVVETFDYTSKSGNFGGFAHSLRLGDGFKDAGGPWKKPGLSVDAWLSTEGRPHAGDFHFTLGPKQDRDAHDDCITVYESEKAGDIETVDLTEALADVIVATQSTNYRGNDFSAYEVIDGITEGRNFNHTRKNGDQWVELDLKDAYDLDSVVVFNRADAVGNRLNGAEVVILDADRNELARFDPISGASTGSEHGYDLSGLEDAQFIRLEHSNQWLHVAEIKVFGTSILHNDTEAGAPYAGGVLTVDGAEGKVGRWVNLDKGRIKINADGTVDFDADGDFDTLNAGDVETVSVNYTIGQLPTGNLIVNGSFETHGALNRKGASVNGERDNWDVFNEIEGWQTPIGVLEIQQGRHGGTPDNRDSNSILELDSHDSDDTNASVLQIVDVEHAGTYTLEFDYSPRKKGNAIGATSEMNVFVNGTKMATISDNTLGYERQSFTFDLEAGQTEIGFSGGGIDDTYGALVDNVSLTGVYDVEATVNIKVKGEDDATGSISGRLFFDADADGQNDDGAQSTNNVGGKTVDLLDSQGNAVTDSNGNAITTTTNQAGVYTFTDIAVGDYIVEFQDPTTDLRNFTVANTGPDATDSDVIRLNPAASDFGQTGVFAVLASQTTTNIDAGVVAEDLIPDLPSD